MTDRYVVSMRPTGLGDRLICLCAAWIFARNTNRILIADWRHSRYAELRRGNLYSLCFVPQTHIANVPFLCDETFTESVLPYPRHPLIWNDEAQWQFPRCFLRPDPELISDTEKAIELIRSTRDVEAPTVVFDGCISNGVVSWSDAFTFFSSLQPQPNVEKEVARFLKTSLRPEPWIGLHVRHGNGGDIMDTRLIGSRLRANLSLRASHRRRTSGNGEQAQVLLSTDSIDVQNAILQNVSGVITSETISRIGSR